MSAKHTPGPWTAQNDGRDIISIQHSNNDPGAISMTLAKVTARMTWRSQAEANARLIAAAPELLKVLRMARTKIAADMQVMAMCHTGPDGLIDDAEVVRLIEAEQDLLNQIDAAVAQAGGAA